MPRKKTPTLTPAELKLMAVVWEKDGATVSDVVAALPARSRPAYNSVLTTMRILEQKGYVRHIKEGRAHRYRPLISRDQARQQVVRHMVSSFFNDSPELLLLSILENENVSPQEMERLKRMTDESE